MKAALITGATHRCGAAIAHRLAADGWHVLVHHAGALQPALRLRDGIEQVGGTASVVEADLRTDAGRVGLIDTAFAGAPGLELVVDTVATAEIDSVLPNVLQNITAAALQDAFVVDVMAPILLAQRFAARLAPDRTGAIVNIVGSRALTPSPDHFSSSVSQATLLGATRLLALALAPRIRVNGIALATGSPDAIAAAVALILETPGDDGHGHRTRRPSSNCWTAADLTGRKRWRK